MTNGITMTNAIAAAVEREARLAHLVDNPWISSHQWFTQSYELPLPILGELINDTRMHQSR